MISGQTQGGFLNGNKKRDSKIFFFAKKYICFQGHGVEWGDFSFKSCSDIKNRNVTFVAPFKNLDGAFYGVDNPIKRNFAFVKNCFFDNAVVVGIGRKYFADPVGPHCDRKATGALWNTTAPPASEVVRKEASHFVPHCNFGENPPATRVLGAAAFVKKLSQNFTDGAHQITVICSGRLCLPNFTFVKLASGSLVRFLKFFNCQKLWFLWSGHGPSHSGKYNHTFNWATCKKKNRNRIRELLILRPPGLHARLLPRFAGLQPAAVNGCTIPLEACASASELSFLASLPGATPNPLLARPFGVLSPLVLVHDGRQHLKELLRHTVRHRGGPEPWARKNVEPINSSAEITGLKTKKYGPEVKKYRPVKFGKTTKMEVKTYV